ncbi:MAG TPA: hypothetical protein PKZ32_06480, partial [Candidatus Melainabacteria bacterium]|nr:hypothetical protein [Candidatus Melainabacteria bacterium]
GPPVPTDAWTHVAVTFDRATGAGKWYVNGEVQAAYAFTLPALDVTNTADFTLGAAGSAFGGGRALIGLLDELEFFPNQAISAATVHDIWAVANRGKCRDQLRLPAVTRRRSGLRRFGYESLTNLQLELRHSRMPPSRLKAR